MKFGTRKDPRISGKAWVNKQLDYMIQVGRLYERERLDLVIGAIFVDGKQTEEEWDALFASALEAETTMKEAKEFGE